MLCKLAWGNVRRAGKDYLVYLLTLTLGVTVFYAFNTVSLQVDIAGIKEEGLAELMGTVLGDLTYFLAGVMAFLMVYANNFIMKRRKREFGLYQVLGMARWRVAVIMVLECVIVSAGALVLGIVLGVLFSQLMTFFTASLFRTQIGDFRFFFSFDAFAMTVKCLVVTFALTLLFDLRTVRRTKIIDLMGAARKNESIKTRRPWLMAAFFVAGAVLVGVAYRRLLHDGLPISGTGDSLSAAMTQFGITTLMVTAGTFLLFFGLSGILIKLVQSLRSIYWRGLNMFTVRQLAAKINTVSFSMGVIAMILFLAITAVTTGMSIASVMNENLDRYNPVDCSQTLLYNNGLTPEYIAEVEKETPGRRYANAEGVVDLMGAWKGAVTDGHGDSTEKRVEMSDIAGSHVQLDQYLSNRAGEDKAQITVRGLCRALGRSVPSVLSGADVETMGLFVMPASEYNACRRMLGLAEVDFGVDGYTITSDMGDTVNELYDAYLAAGKTVELGGHKLKPVTSKVDADASAVADSALGSNPGTVVVPDALIEELGLAPYASNLLVNYKDGLTVAEADKMVDRVQLDDATANGRVVGVWTMRIRRTEMFEQAAMMNGLISYIAIYIGFVLVVACAAILSIQQLSNVADSGRNCRVLAEIGCEASRINRSVLSQQAVFFLFPLAVALAHSGVALHVIIDTVSTFGHMSIAGTVGLTCAIFLAAFGGYFLVTYLMSTGMVRGAIATRYSE